MRNNPLLISGLSQQRSLKFSLAKKKQNNPSFSFAIRFTMRNLQPQN